WEPVHPCGARQQLVPPLSFGEHSLVSFAVGRGGFLVRTIFRVRVLGAHVVMLSSTLGPATGCAGLGRGRLSSDAGRTRSGGRIWPERPVATARTTQSARAAG